MKSLKDQVEQIMRVATRVTPKALQAMVEGTEVPISQDELFQILIERAKGLETCVVLLARELDEHFAGGTGEHE